MEKDIKSFDTYNYFKDDGSLESYIDKLVNELKEDAEVYEQIKPLGLTLSDVRNNIAKLADFKDDYHYCKNCPGLDKCAKKVPHLSMNLVFNNKRVDANYNPCVKMLEKLSFDSSYLVCDFPSEWHNSSLRTLDLSANRRPLIKEFATIMRNESNRWLYVYGDHKVGKSFLLATFTNEFARLKKGRVAFINATKYIKKLADQSIKMPETFNKNMIMLSTVDLLIIDDFGEEYKSEYIRDSIIIPLIAAREKEERLTFFTSSFNLAEIEKMYTIGKGSGDIRARQLVGYIKTMAKKEFDLSGVSFYKK